MASLPKNDFQQIVDTLYSRFRLVGDTNVKGKRILVVTRVSTSKQAKDLVGQMWFVEKTIKENGGTVAGWFQHVGHAGDAKYHSLIAQKAKEVDAEMVVWESADRAIRHKKWNWSRDPLPTKRQMNLFYKTLDGLVLVTCLPYDACKEDVRLHQIYRGKELGGEGYLGGRGNKEKAKRGEIRRKKLLHKALLLHKQGLGRIKIARQLGIPESTVRCWVTNKKYYP